jgi:hypothetical protein
MPYIDESNRLRLNEPPKEHCDQCKMPGNYRWHKSAGKRFPHVDGAVIKCKAHGLLAEEWVYDIDDIEV